MHCELCALAHLEKNKKFRIVGKQLFLRRFYKMTQHEADAVDYLCAKCGYDLLSEEQQHHVAILTTLTGPVDEIEAMLSIYKNEEKIGNVQLIRNIQHLSFK